MKKEIKNMGNALTCEGSCLDTGIHKGEVVAVIVSGNNWGPTNFNYCENAIEEDERRGFTVTIETMMQELDRKRGSIFSKSMNMDYVELYDKLRERTNMHDAIIELVRIVKIDCDNKDIGWNKSSLLERPAP